MIPEQELKHTGLLRHRSLIRSVDHIVLLPVPIGSHPISLLEIIFLALKLLLFHRFSMIERLLLAIVKLRVDHQTIITIYCEIIFVQVLT